MFRYASVASSPAACIAAVAAASSAQAQYSGTANEPPTPLYERLGGLKGITAVVDDFIDRVVTNKTLNRNPEIDTGRKRSPAPYLKYQVSAMVCEVTGGPCKYGGNGMKEAHAHMNITEKEWDVMVGEFKKSLAKFKVPAKEQQELFEIVGKMKANIVVAAPPRGDRSGAIAPPTSVLHRRLHVPQAILPIRDRLRGVRSRLRHLR